MNNNNIIMTRHSEKRSKERLGLNRAAAQRNAKKAMELGLGREELCGKLKKFMDATWAQYETANNIRLYHRGIYIFIDSTLVTVFLLPAKYSKQSDVAEKRMRCMREMQQCF